ATVAFATVNASDVLNIGSGYQNAGGSTVTPTINITGPGMVALNSGSGAFRGGWDVQSGVLRVVANNSLGVPDAAGPLVGSSLTLSGGELLVRSNAALSFNAGAGANIPVIVTADSIITHQRTAAGAGLDTNFGTLSIGTAVLTTRSDASVTSGS